MITATPFLETSHPRTGFARRHAVRFLIPFISEWRVACDDVVIPGHSCLIRAIWAFKSRCSGMCIGRERMAEGTAAPRVFTISRVWWDHPGADWAVRFVIPFFRQLGVQGSKVVFIG